MILAEIIKMPRFVAEPIKFDDWLMRVYDGEMPGNIHQDANGELLCAMKMTIDGNNFHCGGDIRTTGKAGYFRLFNLNGGVESQGKIGHYGEALNMASTSLIAGGQMHVDGRLT